MGCVCAVITNAPHCFFMNPRGIINAYQHAQTIQERNALANRLMDIIIRRPLSENWNFLADEIDPEEWRNIEGFNGGVQISNWGRVRKIGVHGKEVAMRQKASSYTSFSGNRYPHTRIGSKRNYTPILIHIEVARAFIPNPGKLPVVNHKDGDKNNPYYKNLEWSTEEGNTQHAWATGLNPSKGSGNFNSKITEEQALYIFNSKEKTQELAKTFGITGDNVCCIKRGETWSHVTGKVFKPQKIKDELAVKIFNDTGLTNRELAIKYAVRQTTVYNIKRGFTFTSATGAKRHPIISNKVKGNSFYLGEEMVIEIFKSEGSPKKLAKRFGVSPMTVYEIKKGKRWGDITKNI